MAHLTAEEHERRLALYDQGLMDSEIAALEGCTPKPIQRWRARRNLPPNTTSGHRPDGSRLWANWSPELKGACLALLRRGVGAITIARELEISTKSLERWRSEMLRECPNLRRPGTARRRVPRWPSGRTYSRLKPDRRKRAFELYLFGKDDHQIALELGINRAQAWEWRTALFLPPNLARGTTRRKARPKERRKDVGAAITPWSNPLYAAVAKAVGGGLARDMADDAISEVCLAIQEGRASLADLVSVARKARGRVTSSFGSDRRTVSLHLALPGTDDLLPIDLLVDERSSTWLEEMGATVW